VEGESAMKIVRFQFDNNVFTGRIENDRILPWGENAAQRDLPLSEARLLAPAVPTKVVAVGLNYVDHARELSMALPEEPLLFMKPASSVIGPDDPIVMPPQSDRVDFEAELAVVIGKRARNVPRGSAADYILGYTCLNDVTARDLQQKDGQWTRAKGFDTFCPLGPWIETEISPADLAVELRLNGVVKQRSRTSNLVFDPHALVEYISAVMTLEIGDVIATGTPAGIGPMCADDIVEVLIEGIGVLRNRARLP
jgi:2-keto-4-pentenoate hydratase/2-oxohepta-3-ene-1,7-dioic acid hydratase in catechol pathway